LAQDASRRVNCYAADIVTSHLDLAGVEARP
jgi:hypothetical protein